jgi:hypothetical protein
MMKPAEKRPHGELTEPLDRAVGRRILAHGQKWLAFVHNVRAVV